jgi:geranylgeranyl transferase type-2 subunit alpha
MHNQNRAEYKARLADPAVAGKLAGKASQWTALTRELVSRRAGTAGTAPPAASASSPPAVPPSEAAVSTLKMIEKLLTVNPDPAHLWNHRRELLLLPMSTADAPSESANDDAPETSALDVSTNTSTNFDLDDELKLTAACLQRNAKAYAAWFHRKWAVRHWLLISAASATEEQRSALLQTELGLCASFLDRDERNFHCWNYRRFVVALMLEVSLLDNVDENDVSLDGSWNRVGDAVVMGPQVAIINTDKSESKEQRLSPGSVDEVIRSEFEYTSQRIEKNFSNCSAFHYRSKLIDLVLDADLRAEGISRNEEGEAYQVRLDMSRGELEMVQSAVFTEPDDQTAWWYHRFVLAWARPKPLEHWTDQDAAAEAMELFAEVLEEEKESIRELLEAESGKCKWGLLALHMVLTDLMDRVNTDRESLVEEANDCIDQLTALDPDRSTRYKSMRG